MIAYDLQCCDGHSFEGWFDNAEAFDKQKESGMLTCPVCGATEVDRKLSTFGIARHRNMDTPPSEGSNPMQAVIQYVRDNFEDVGANFTKEALKIHYGVAEKRNIRGVSTENDETLLKQEGINFYKIPMPSEPSKD